jgi:RimJ/RimL family protein N-acetyltransferase
MKTLETERLLLRPFTPEDEAIHQAVFSDPEVCHFYCRDTKTIEEVREWLVYRQRQGYAAEACRALIDYAFRELKLPRIAYGVDGDNVASWRLMKHLGFRLGKDPHPDGNGVTGVLENTMAT